MLLDESTEGLTLVLLGASLLDSVFKNLRVSSHEGSGNNAKDEEESAHDNEGKSEEEFFEFSSEASKDRGEEGKDSSSNGNGTKSSLKIEVSVLSSVLLSDSHLEDSEDSGEES